MVHQHFRLVQPFTVAENIALGDQRDRALVPDRAALERKVAALARQFGLAVDPRARIWQLSVGEQQRVEILKALYRDARVLILDEPTAVLTPQEARALFETLRAMAADGRAIVFISHKLHEVLAVSDRVTVLRGGRVVGTLATESATPEGWRPDGRARGGDGETPGAHRAIGDVLPRSARPARGGRSGFPR